MDEVALWNVSLTSEIIAKHAGYGIDKSRYGNNASYMNGSRINQSGKFGEAMQFDGIDDSIGIPDAAGLDGMAAFSAEAWFKQNTLSNGGNIISKANSDGNVAPCYGNVYQISANGAGTAKLNAYLCSSVPSLMGMSTGSYSANIWNHIALTYNGATARLYLNGNEIGSTSFTGNIKDDTTKVLIGSYNNAVFNGTIDEVAIWNTSLSADKVAEHAGAKVVDHSQYGNNGTRKFNSTSDFGRNYTDGKFGKGLVFDGVNDLVNVTSFPNNVFNKTYAVELWVKSADTKVYQTLYSKIAGSVLESGAYLNYPSAGKVDFYTGSLGNDADSLVSNAANLNNGNWRHLVFARDNSTGTLRIFVDGILDASRSEVNGPGFSPSGLVIGAERMSGFFNGTID